MARQLMRARQSGAADAAQPLRPVTSSLGIFAINLDRSPERMAAIRSHFGRLPWPLYRVPALDARKEPDAVLAARCKSIIQPPEGLGWNPYRYRQFSLTEEACLVSHMAAWRQFLASGHERGLILEDDAEPHVHFVTAVRTLLAEGTPIDIVKLEGTARTGGRLAVAIRSLGSEHTLVRSLRPSSGAAAYILTRAAAERLLERLSTVTMPVDDFLWSQPLHGLDVAQVSPWVVVQSGATSTLEQGRLPSRKTKRRDLAAIALQLTRRTGIRFGLWWGALQGRPWRLLSLRRAPWMAEPCTDTRTDNQAAQNAASSN